LIYKTVATKTFLRQLKKIPEDAQQRVSKAVNELISKPDSGTKLKGELEGLWRARVGEYRIIYEIDYEKNIIVLLDVGLRKNIYA